MADLRLKRRRQPDLFSIAEVTEVVTIFSDKYCLLRPLPSLFALRSRRKNPPYQLFQKIQKSSPKVMQAGNPMSVRSSPLESQDNSRDVSRDVSRHGSTNRSSHHTLATYEEDAADPWTEAGDGVLTASGGGDDDGAGVTAAAAENAAAAAAAMAAAWTGGSSGTLAARKKAAGERMDKAAARATAAAAAAAAAEAEAYAAAVGAGTPAPYSTTVLAAAAAAAGTSPSSSAIRTTGEGDADGGRGERERQSGDERPTAAELTLSIPAQEGGEWEASKMTVGPRDAVDAALMYPAEETGPVSVATAVAVGVKAVRTPPARPPLGTGVQADPTSHQHKRPVSIILCVVLTYYSFLRIVEDYTLWASKYGVCGVFLFSATSTRLG